MIVEYHRPQKLVEALALLARKTPKTRPLAGGTQISHASDDIAVVDLQALGLNKIAIKESAISIGATATLQEIADNELIPPELRNCALLETSRNLRNMGSLAGCLVAADGRSMLLSALLSLDAVLIIEPGREKLSIQDWLAVKKVLPFGGLISRIDIPIKKMRIETVRRSPKDLPLLSAFGSKDKKGILRVAIGGKTLFPFLVDPARIFSHSLEPEYAKYKDSGISKEYFFAVLPELVERVLEDLK